MNNYPACPECERLADISKESNKIGDFLSWLQQSGIYLTEWKDKRFFDEDGNQLKKYERDCEIEPEGYYPYRKSIERILADYFEIDLDLVDKERAALLEHSRNNGQ